MPSDPQTPEHRNPAVDINQQVSQDLSYIEQRGSLVPFSRSSAEPLRSPAEQAQLERELREAMNDEVPHGPFARIREDPAIPAREHKHRDGDASQFSNPWATSSLYERPRRRAREEFEAGAEEEDVCLVDKPNRRGDVNPRSQQASWSTVMLKQASTWIGWFR